MKRFIGFTLIELLIVISIVSLLAIMIISVINPLEQIKKSRDTTTLNTASEILAAIIRSSGASKKAISAEVRGASLKESEGKAVIISLSDMGELKNNFVNSVENMRTNLYLTGKMDLSQLHVCFVPESKSFKTSNMTAFNVYGEAENCTENSCYLCLENLAGSKVKESEDTTEESTTVSNSCEGYDPYYPQYPFTCDYSTKWSQYGCTNFCVADFGCDSYCPPGQRHLAKSFYSANASGVMSCIIKVNETREHYCVSGEAANCAELPHRSSTSDFEWGCENPRRPFKWI